MMKSPVGPYVIGIDFGTLSARAAVFRVRDGNIVSSSSFAYPHGVITEGFPSGYALADPDDYGEALVRTVRAALESSGVPAGDVIGIGIDATASSFLPLDENGIPLCKKPGFAHRPHAMMKLWKHHGAQKEALDLTRTAQERKEAFLTRTGGKINAEWMLPKLLEIYREDREVFDATRNFSEIGDELVYRLTGNRTLGAGILGYKMLLSPGDPSITEEYLEAAEPGFSAVFEKHPGTVVPLGRKAGSLTQEAASVLGLPPGIPVASANIDAHAAFPASGITEPGTMLLIMGTSCCAITLHPEYRPVEGVFGIVKDGALPGYYGYESGQSAVGDMLSWFVRNAVPGTVTREAEAEGIGIQQLLTRRAAALRPGQTGLMVLDWFNGNRSVLSDADLSGLIVGLTLNTRPEEIYRAMLEGLAFGLKVILDSYADAGIPLRELAVTGGIAHKNPLLLQICADVTGLPVRRVLSTEGSALGAAICAAAAAGEASGGYPGLTAAARNMGHTEETAFLPDPARGCVYRRLYGLWLRLHDGFGRGDPLMRALREEADRAAAGGNPPES